MEGMMMEVVVSVMEAGACTEHSVDLPRVQQPLNAI